MFQVVVGVCSIIGVTIRALEYSAKYALRAKLTVELGFGCTTSGTNAVAPLIMMRTYNRGTDTVNIVCGGMLYGQGNYTPIAEPYSIPIVEFPYCLRPGEELNARIRAELVALALAKMNLSDKTKIRAYFQDQSGKVYLSKPVDANLILGKSVRLTMLMRYCKMLEH